MPAAEPFEPFARATDGRANPGALESVQHDRVELRRTRRRGSADPGREGALPDRDQQGSGAAGGSRDRPSDSAQFIEVGIDATGVAPQDDRDVLAAQFVPETAAGDLEVHVFAGQDRVDGPDPDGIGASRPLLSL